MIIITENYGNVTLEEFLEGEDVTVVFTLSNNKKFEVEGYTANDLMDENFISDVFGCESFDDFIENSLPRKTDKKKYSIY